jgi:hypothetical protein
MTNILDYIINFIERLKSIISRKPKMVSNLDETEKTVLLYNPNTGVNEDAFDIFIVENPNKKLRIKIFE